MAMSPNTQVELLQNSGFDGENIPDSISVAREAKTILTQGIFKRQANNIVNIRIDMGDEGAAQVDYAILTKDGRSYCYFVTGYTMLSPRTAVFALQMDALTTTNALSNESAVSIKGWLTRKNKTLDEMSNTDEAIKLKLSEPWKPSDELVDDYYGNILHSNEADHDWFVLSTIDLIDLPHKAKKYVDPDTKSSVTVPELPTVPLATVYSIQGLGAWKIPFSAVYDGTADGIKTAINDARSLGVESAIQASYVIPKNYVTYEGSALHSRVEGVMATENTGITADISGVTVENKKAMYLYQTVKLMSMCSGKEENFNLSQIGHDFDITYYSDPHPDGAPFARFKTINGNTDDVLLGAVRGSTWQTQPLGYTQRSGASLEARQYNREQGMSVINGATNAAEGMTGAIATGNAVAGVNTGINSVKSVMNVFNKEKEFQEQQRLVSPQIDFAMSDNIQNYVGNDFAILRKHLSVDDMHRFDEFLHQFGESVHEEFNKASVHTMGHYNYIQCKNVLIDSTFPRYITQVAKTQLEGGVRVWHTLPSDAALEIGGN